MKFSRKADVLKKCDKNHDIKNLDNYYINQLKSKCLHGYWLDENVDEKLRKNYCNFIKNYAVDIYVQSNDNEKKLIEKSLSHCSMFIKNRKFRYTKLYSKGFLYMLCISGTISSATTYGFFASIAMTYIFIKQFKEHRDYNIILKAEKDIKNITNC